MHIDIITLFPDVFKNIFDTSILKRAIDKKILNINIHNLRDYGLGKHKQVDDYQFGGGSGMVMMIEPIDKCISHLSAKRKYDEIIFLTPDGEKFNQKIANELSLKKNLILLSGRYKGVDERVRDKHITRELSIGDFVLSGGELPTAIIVDAIVRLIPGVLNDETSALNDSFQNDLLSPPVYTRPANYKGHKVPEILLSGNLPEIEKWRHKMAVEKTKKRRPDLLNL